MSRTPSTRAALATALTACLVSACGSTVAMTSSARTAGGDGLNGTASGPSTVDGSGGSVLGGGTASSGTPGSSGSLAPGSAGAPGTQGGAVTTSGPGVPSGTSGVPAGTAPIKIGIVLTSTASVQAAGFSSGESYSERQVDDALVNALNSTGGVNGHKLVPVYASTDPNSSNWSADFAAACATFTQDNHVAAVVGYQFNYDQSFETCLTKNGVPHLTTGFNIPDQTELAKHPLHRALAVPTIDLRSSSKLAGAWRDGWLNPKSKLGAVIDSCPGTTASWNRVSKPFLESHKIPYVLYAGGCSNGSADGANGAQQVPGALLKMRQEGVTAISFLTVSEGPALAIVSNAAESQGWRPLYIVSSLANLSALSGNASVVPPAQMANVKGYGWMPAQDLSPRSQPPLTAGQKRCLTLLKSQKVVPANFGDYTNAYRICDGVFAYELALKADGTKTQGSALIAALDGLGTSFSDPDVLDGATLLTRARANNAPSHLRAVVYSSGCQCFVYTGPTRPLR